MKDSPCLLPPVPSAPASPAALDPLARDVFGVMGNGNAWFLDAVVTASALRYTAVRHEAAAVAAADAYHRSSGRLAIATTTYGPGYTNALTPADRGGAGAHPAGTGDRCRTGNTPGVVTSTSARSPPRPARTTSRRARTMPPR